MFDQHLEDLKEKGAKVIIAEVNDVVARQLMCRAFKLNMNAEQVICGK